MVKQQYAITALVLALTAQHSLAVELAQEALFLDVGLKPGDLELHIHTADGTFSGTETAQHRHINLGWYRSYAEPGRRHGWLTEIGFAFAHAPLDNGSFSSYGLQSQLAYAYALNERWSMWGGVTTAVLLADMDFDLVSLGATRTLSSNGVGWFAGPTLTANWQLADNWSLGAHVGWSIHSYTLYADPLDFTLEADGMSFGLRLSYATAVIFTDP